MLVRTLGVSRERARPDFGGAALGFRHELDDEFDNSGLNHLKRKTALFANAKGPVLVDGPSGSGKTHLARLIHQTSIRGSEICLQHGCGDFDASIFASTLFGHVAGAYTGADTDRDGLLHHANGGTLILDDMDYLPLDSQKRLLRFLDDSSYHRVGEPHKRREAKIKLIFTTNKSLSDLVERGEFLPDLYFRVRRFRVSLPPLRKRLRISSRMAARMFRERLSGASGGEAVAVEDALLNEIDRLPLPGNFRDLIDLVENTVLLAEPDRNGVITLAAARSACPDFFFPNAEAGATSDRSGHSASHEDQEILKLLKKTNWNISATHRLSGRSRNTIYDRIRVNGWVRGRI